MEQFPDAEQRFESILDSYLLKCNNPPTQIEHLSLDSTRKDIVASLQRVEESIVTAKRRLESLQVRKARLQKLLDEYSIPLAPIRRVPADVMLYIFKEFHAEYPHANLDVNYGLWKLTQVCSSWRSIIHDTPSFWNNIFVDLRTCLPAYSTTILSSIIGRTKSLDLDIIFYMNWTDPHDHPSGSDNTFDCISKQLFELLCSFSYRWSSFDCTVPPSHWDCFRQVKDTLLRFEALSIDIIDAGCDPTQPILGGTCTFFAQAPKLKRVSLGPTGRPPLMPLSLTVTELAIKLHPLFRPRLFEIIPATVNKLVLLHWPEDQDNTRTSTVYTSLPNVTSLDAYAADSG